MTKADSVATTAERSQYRTPDSDGVREVWRALRQGWLLMAACGVAVGLIALGASIAQTPEYQSTATMYVTSGSDDNSATAYQGSLASQQRVASYGRLVTTNEVVSKALAQAALRLSLSDAKKALTATAVPDTVLLDITTTDSDPGVARDLANSVAASMTAYVAQLETPAVGGQPLAKLSLVSPAEAAGTPVSPKTIRNVVIGVLAGLFIGILSVLTRARLGTRITGEDEVTELTGLPILGLIPDDDRLKRRGVIDFSSGAMVAAEAYRKLRTNLAFTQVDSPPKLILISSAVSGEGKTTTVMNLAAALVEDGKSVVVVDADLRRPQVSSRSDVLASIGLTSWLRGDTSIDDLVQQSAIPGLYILAAGPRPPNPAELLGTQRSASALDKLAKSFDYVLVDTPPALPVTDAAIVAQFVDGVILVARTGKTKVSDLLAACDAMAVSRTSLLGIVLTQVRTPRSRYGYAPTDARPSLFRRRRRSKEVAEVLTADGKKG